MALLATLFNCLPVRGASVAIIIIMLPFPSPPLPGQFLSSNPTGTPAIVRSSLLPKLLRTSAPTVYFLPSISTILEADPIPPLNSKALIPVPAPTAPSSKSSSALFIASTTCSLLTCLPLMSLRYESLHSSTRGLTEPVVTPMSSFSSRM
ncbi:149aa long hypothetical protein [Pyrococcus horikoshii OT3]|uniref:Uncharacterized protein n=1 Tax=Pyrococcus horikoshii (strain ATCC 700860 / DSM 12428 / JCM 9974 / NBRC 100139 / OT-3) TaxID=70601 RepID=O57785_PYRHO|nr:149aa long hypothetical protein [Pyrococcus horikoshii OT3]